jgi:hypothetical protein
LQNRLQDIIASAVPSYFENELSKWVVSWAGQAIVCGRSINWFGTEILSKLGFFVKNVDRGRCNDHNFRRCLPIFGEKMASFSKTNVMILFGEKLVVGSFVPIPSTEENSK